MLKKLQDRWKVNGINLILIIATFALGGSLCGWAGRKILLWTSLERGIAWFILYLILISLLWPLCVLIISYPLGQFRFFRNYLIKIWNRINGKKNLFKNTGRIKLAIFSSGAGSNAKKIIEYFSSTPVKIDLVLTNNPSAGVIRIAAENNIDCWVIDKEKFFNGNAYLPELKERGINLLVLAGFLWKIPAALVNAYPKKIINIHPALLPKYGGKGMYGHFVHEAVIADKEKQSGITIHFADEMYDHGEIIFQVTCEVVEGETPESLSKKIQVLEHLHYPTVIDGILKKQNPR